MWRSEQFVRAWWPTCAVSAAILYVVLMPHPPQPPQLPLFFGADKIIHAAMMATLTAAALNDRRRAGLSLSLAAVASTVLWVMAFSVVTEILQQALTETRSADIADIAADWLGTALAAATALPVLRSKRR